MAEETKNVKNISRAVSAKNEKSNKPVKEIKDTKETKEKEKNKDKDKVKLSVRIKKFIKDYRAEMKKIVWPTRQQVIKNTSVVVFVIAVVAAFVGVLDLLFGMGIRMLANL